MTAEQDKMNDCYYAKRDWRACKDEVSCYSGVQPFQDKTFVPHLCQLGSPNASIPSGIYMATANSHDRFRWKRFVNAGNARAMTSAQNRKTHDSA